MKSNKGFRATGNSGHDLGETTRKAVKLPPIKKSGKDRHVLYCTLEEEEGDDELTVYKRRESVLDYFDDGQDDDWDEEDEQTGQDDDWDEEDEQTRQDDDWDEEDEPNRSRP